MELFPLLKGIIKKYALFNHRTHAHPPLPTLLFDFTNTLSIELSTPTLKSYLCLHICVIGLTWAAPTIFVQCLNSSLRLERERERERHTHTNTHTDTHTHTHTYIHIHTHIHTHTHTHTHDWDAERTYEYFDFTNTVSIELTTLTLKSYLCLHTCVIRLTWGALIIFVQCLKVH